MSGATTPVTVADVLADLVAEQEALDAIVASAEASDWERPTASPRWSVADQIGHLAYFDGTAAQAIADPDAFVAHAEELFASFASAEAVDEATLGEFRSLDPDELLARWRQNRNRLAEVASGLADDDRVVWYGPSMGSKSFLTARLMECWAHGQDVADALGARREPTDRLAHIARLGFNTRGWSFVNRGLDVPDTPIRVTLRAPSGATWTYGPADATDRIDGDAEDFCLVVTQRRHVDATNLVLAGAPAREWMTIAQAFAGPPTTGPTSSA